MSRHHHNLRRRNQFFNAAQRFQAVHFRHPDIEQHEIRRIGRELNRQAGPLLERSRTLAANLEYISAQVRSDVESLNGSVKALSDRLHQASDHMEDRINEFNALMEVVQGEAEGMFLDTAATVRGLRAGADQLTSGAEDVLGIRSSKGRCKPSGCGEASMPGDALTRPWLGRRRRDGQCFLGSPAP